MKNSKVLYLLLAFVMCLSLAACGGGGEEITTPAWFEGMVSDSQNKVDINTYGGTWTGDRVATKCALRCMTLPER